MVDFGVDTSEVSTTCCLVTFSVLDTPVLAVVRFCGNVDCTVDDKGLTGDVE